MSEWYVRIPLILFEIVLGLFVYFLSVAIFSFGLIGVYSSVIGYSEDWALNIIVIIVSMISSTYFLGNIYYKYRFDMYLKMRQLCFSIERERSKGLTVNEEKLLQLFRQYYPDIRINETEQIIDDIRAR